jgi:hypothetical protein
MKYEKLTKNIIFELFNISDADFLYEFKDFELNDINQLDFLLVKISELKEITYCNTSEVYILNNEIISSTTIFKKINPDFNKALNKKVLNNIKPKKNNEEFNKETNTSIFKDNIERRPIKKKY